MARRIIITCLLYICFSLNAVAQQLVLPGDYPDPSIVKIGSTYWATATTSNWFPAYPLLRSKDLINWKQQGYVFNQMPKWVDYYFWAPEITYENGKVYVYYSAHKKNGNLCLGVASANKPEGPYKDHGPLMCQEVGSIDAFPMRDDNGKLYLIWKEDGNSVNKPTSIWAMQMNESRTALLGEKTELFRNTEPWEGNLVEGVSMVKNNGYYYAFYAGAGCCGAGCTYAIGVARSKNLLGPWEKYNNNPVLTGNDEWKCPGHGTAIQKNGRNYFMYHAYNKKSTIFTGREGLIIEYKFTSDDWVEFIKEDRRDNDPPRRIEDDFTASSLSQNWQWSVFQKVGYKIKNGDLILEALPTGSFLGQKVLADDYNATTVIDGLSTAFSGIALIGDDKNYVAAVYKEGNIKCIRVKDGKEETIIQKQVGRETLLSLRVKVSDSKNADFMYSLDGKRFNKLTRDEIDVSSLPPWDRALRVGVLSKGTKRQNSIFKSFELQNK